MHRRRRQPSHTVLRAEGADLIFPATAVFAEYLDSVFYGSWAAVPYSQFNNLPLIQLSSLAGMWGVTFNVMWFASVLDWAWEGGLDRGRLPGPYHGGDGSAHLGGPHHGVSDPDEGRTTG